MIIDIKDIKVYLISPATDKYRHRVNTVFGRLLDAGFKSIEFVRSLPSHNNVSSLTNTCIKIFKQEMNNIEPFIIIEDDCEFFYKYDKIEMPDEFDALYLGVSQWVYPHPVETIPIPVRPPIEHNSPSTIKSYNDNLTKIIGMCSTHAILYRSRNYLKTFIDIMYWGATMSNNLNHDLIFAVIQKNFEVFALKKPMFYQDTSLGGQEDATKLTYNGSYYEYIH